MGGGSSGEERPAPGPPLTWGHLHPAPPWSSLPPEPLVDDGSQGVRPGCLASSWWGSRGAGSDLSSGAGSMYVCLYVCVCVCVCACVCVCVCVCV